MWVPPLFLLFVVTFLRIFVRRSYVKPVVSIEENRSPVKTILAACLVQESQVRKAVATKRLPLSYAKVLHNFICGCFASIRRNIDNLRRVLYNTQI